MTETKPLAGVILFGFGRNCHQLVAVGEKKEKRAALAIFLDMSSLGRWIWRGRTELLVSLRRNGMSAGVSVFSFFLCCHRRNRVEMVRDDQLD